MKRKNLAIMVLILLAFGIANLTAADIRGKVTLSPKGKPYTKGSILLKALGEEKFEKAEIDTEGNYAFADLIPGRYILKMDLYGLTPIEQEIEINEAVETLVLDLPISLSILDRGLVFIKDFSDFVWFPVMVDVDVFSATRLDKAGYYPGAIKAAVELTVDKTTAKVVGANVVCEGSAALTIDTAAAAIFSGMNVKDLGWFDAAYAPPYAPVWNALISAALKAAKI